MSRAAQPACLPGAHVSGSRWRGAVGALLLLIAPTLARAASAADVIGPDTVVVMSGALRLRALVYRPSGPGPHPAILFNHGSGHATGKGDHRHPELIGPLFAKHGYVLFHLDRRGDGLSAGQGVPSADQMDAELAARGQEARNRLQLHLLETDELNDAQAGLRALRALPGVDPARVGVVGHSFGASLSLLLAERDSTLRAVICFSGSALSWNRSPELRERLREAVERMHAPAYFIHAANDFSVAPGRELAGEMERLGKPHRIRIYPAVGTTPEEGHGFIYLDVSSWESDVFGFLDATLGR